MGSGITLCCFVSVFLDDDIAATFFIRNNLRLGWNWTWGRGQIIALQALLPQCQHGHWERWSYPVASKSFRIPKFGVYSMSWAVFFNFFFCWVHLSTYQVSSPGDWTLPSHRRIMWFHSLLNQVFLEVFNIRWIGQDRYSTLGASWDVLMWFTRSIPTFPWMRPAAFVQGWWSANSHPTRGHVVLELLHVRSCRTWLAVVDSRELWEVLLRLAGWLRITYCLVDGSLAMKISTQWCLFTENLPTTNRHFPLDGLQTASICCSNFCSIHSNIFLISQYGTQVHEQIHYKQPMFWVLEHVQEMGNHSWPKCLKHGWITRLLSRLLELRTAYWLGAPNGSRRHRTPPALFRWFVQLLKMVSINHFFDFEYDTLEWSLNIRLKPLGRECPPVCLWIKFWWVGHYI